MISIVTDDQVRVRKDDDARWIDKLVRPAPWTVANGLQKSSILFDHLPYVRIHERAYTAATFHAMFGGKRLYVLMADGMQCTCDRHSASQIAVRCEAVRGNGTRKVIILSEEIKHSQGISFLGTRRADDAVFSKLIVGITTETDPNFVFINGILFSLQAERQLGRKFHLTVDTASCMFGLVDQSLEVVRCVNYSRLVRGAPTPIRFFICVTTKTHFKISTYLHPCPLT